MQGLKELRNRRRVWEAAGEMVKRIRRIGRKRRFLIRDG
jgi:hypothetical protein